MPTLSGLPEAVVVPPDVVPVLPEPPPPHAARTSIAAAADRLPRVLSCRVSTTTSLFPAIVCTTYAAPLGMSRNRQLRPARTPAPSRRSPPLEVRHALVVGVERERRAQEDAEDLGPQELL